MLSDIRQQCQGTKLQSLAVSRLIFSSIGFYMVIFLFNKNILTHTGDNREAIETSSTSIVQTPIPFINQGYLT
jgi:hypothetical protein